MCQLSFLPSAGREMSSRVSRKSGLKLFIASCIFAYICLFIKWSWLCCVCAFHFGFGSCTVAFLLPLLTITLVVQVWYMIWLTLNMGRSDVNCKGNVSKFHVVWRWSPWISYEVEVEAWRSQLPCDLADTVFRTNHMLACGTGLDTADLPSMK